ncbi:hypothetical protein D3C80_2215910 [compost metagenome]
MDSVVVSRRPGTFLTGHNHRLRAMAMEQAFGTRVLAVLADEVQKLGVSLAAVT